MPELPELEVLKDTLSGQIKGKHIQALQILKPYVLKNYFSHDLSGETVKSVERRGKYIIIRMSTYTMLIHLMLRGTLTYVLPSHKPTKSVAALLMFQDGTVLELGERGHKKRVSFYVCEGEQSLEHLGKLGAEPLELSFTVKKLGALLQHKPRRLKSFLRDQRTIAGIGNAYADEILWKACLSPFKMTTRLTVQDTERLHAAITEVLRWAIDQVKKRGRSEKRDFLRIHGCENRPCPRCKTPLQSVQTSDSETFYCPPCQTAGRKLKDGRLSKFYR